MKVKSDRWQAQYGPWAVVTGASNGIGKAFASTLAEAGLNLVLVARRRDMLELFGRQLAEHHGLHVKTLALDVGQPGALGALVDATYGLEVGLLVAAAGYGTSGPFIDSALEVELDMIEVNCRAVVGQVLHFGRIMAKQGHGGLVLMSSLLAFQGVPRAANYAATKAYIQTFAEGLAAELSPLGVDVVSCAPGPVHSGFANRARMRMSMAQEPKVVAEGTLAALGRRVTVRPGWLSKVLEGSMIGLPRTLRLRIMSLVMKDMTRHQHDETLGKEAKSA